MTTQGDSVTGERPEAETLARAFHETYERLAPSHGYETRKASAVPWEDVPEPNKNLMVEVAHNVLEQFWPAERPAEGTSDGTEALESAVEGVVESYGIFRVQWPNELFNDLVSLIQRQRAEAVEERDAEWEESIRTRQRAPLRRGEMQRVTR